MQCPSCSAGQSPSGFPLRRAAGEKNRKGKSAEKPQGRRPALQKQNAPVFTGAHLSNEKNSTRPVTDLSRKTLIKINATDAGAYKTIRNTIPSFANTTKHGAPARKIGGAG